jgi:hypothetical protein
MAVGKCFDITKGLTTNGARQRKAKKIPRKLASRRDAENAEKERADRKKGAVPYFISTGLAP